MLGTIVGASATVVITVTAIAAAGAPPPADTAAVSAVIGPSGGQIGGFGVTATFAPGALTSAKLVVLGNWPNGLDVPPPNGETAVKTFGLQVCNLDGTGCTSPFGDYNNSPSGGTQPIRCSASS